MTNQQSAGLRLAKAFALASLLWALPASQARSADGMEIHGAGSSFVAPLMTQWSDDYGRASGARVSYDSVGSGAGIERVLAGAVDFGATDKPLSPDELEKAGLCQFPIVVGGIVPVVNLPGVAAGAMRFSGALLGNIYLGRVTSWSAPEIRALNPGLDLPAIPIAVVHRADGSGTTYNWVDFLSKTNPDWKSKVGVGLTVAWPVGVGGDGNGGVAAAVAQTSGAIGYVEYAYALRSKLAFAQVENAYGLFISPSPDSFEAAASTVRWREHRDFSTLLTSAVSANAYPIAAATFILMHRAPKDPSKASAMLAFFKWALEQGAGRAAELNYVALPPNLVKLIEAYWVEKVRPQSASTSGSTGE